MTTRLLFSVGIAAIDGLLCAFVAVLALAFLMQGEEQPSAGELEAGMLILTFEKLSGKLGVDATNTLVGLRFRDARSQECPWLRFPSPPSPNENCGLELAWRDCEGVASSCVSSVAIYDVRRRDSFDLRFVTLGPASDNVDVPSSIYLAPVMLDGASGGEQRLDARELIASSVYGLALRVSVSDTGRANVRWISAANPDPRQR